MTMPVTEMHKRVASVTPVPLSDETTADLVATDTVIPLANSGDFELGDAPSGLVIIDGDVYSYSVVEEGEDDDTPEPSITLDSGLLGDIVAGTIVAVWDAGANGGTGAVAVEYMVDVTDDLDGSPGQAYLHYSLIPSLPEGLPPDVGDSVTVRIDEDGDWWVVNVHGRRATVDPGHLRTGTLQADVSVTVGTPGAQRVVIDGSPAIELYNAANEQTGNLDGDQNFLQGSIATDADGEARVEVGQGESFGHPAEEVRFYTGHADEDEPAVISSLSIFTSGENVGALRLVPPEFDATHGLPVLALQSGVDAVSSSANLTAETVTLTASGATLDSNDPSILMRTSDNKIIVNAPVDATMGDGSVGTGTFRDSVRTAVVTTGTTANFNAIGNAVNTTGKYTGRLGFNTTTGKLIVATGSTAAAVWNNSGTGAVEHTPA